jgi:WD40 repeat protein
VARKSTRKRQPSIPELLDRLDAEIRAVAIEDPTYRDCVPRRGKPASTGKLAKLEKSVGPLPPRYRAFLALCDGYADDEEPAICGLYSIAQMLPGSETRTDSDRFRDEMLRYGDEELRGTIAIGKTGQRHLYLDPKRTQDGEPLILEAEASDTRRHAGIRGYLEGRVEYCEFLRSARIAEVEAERKTAILEAGGNLPQIISAIAFSPDSAQLAAGTTAGRVWLFDTKPIAVDKRMALLPRMSWSMGDYEIRSLTFLDPARLIVQIGNAVSVWDTAKATKLAIELPSAGYENHAISASGLVAVDDNGSVRLATEANPQLHRGKQLTDGNPLIAMAFSADESRLWAIREWSGTIYEWDVKKKKLAATHELAIDVSETYEAAFSPSLARIAIGDHGSRRARVFEVATGTLVFEFPATGPRAQVAFHPSETLLARGGPTTEIFSLESGKLVTSLGAEKVKNPPGHSRSPSSVVAWSPDGRLLVNSQGFVPRKGIRVWTSEEVDPAGHAKLGRKARR